MVVFLVAAAYRIALVISQIDENKKYNSFIYLFICSCVFDLHALMYFGVEGKQKPTKFKNPLEGS